MVLLLLAEVVFVLAIAVGVGLMYVPAGIIVGGVLGVLACEVASARRRVQQAAAAGPARTRRPS